MNCFFTIYLSLIALVVGSQTPVNNHWSLEQCIDSALINNYTIRTAKIQSKIAETSFINAKHNYLPTLNGGAIHGYNWGQKIDPFTNQFATSKVQYNSFYLNSSLVLFTGLQKYYNKQVLAIDYKSQQYNLRIEERNIKKKIATAYLQVLLNKEVLLISKEQLLLTNKLKKRIELLIQSEHEPQNKLLEVLAQKEADQYAILKAENDYKSTLLLLQQLMNKTYDSSFNITAININRKQLSIVDIENSPELKMSELSIQKQELVIKKNKGSFSPSLTLNGALGSGYSENNKTINTITGEYSSKPFKTQLGENFYESVYFSLNIPIYNNKTSKNQYQISIIEREQIQLDKANTMLTFQNEIQQLKFDVINFESQLKSLKLLLNANENNFDNAQAKYENGIISFTDLLTIKNKLFQTKSEYIQVRYRLFISQFFLSLYGV